MSWVAEKGVRTWRPMHGAASSVQSGRQAQGGTAYGQAADSGTASSGVPPGSAGCILGSQRKSSICVRCECVSLAVFPTSEEEMLRESVLSVHKRHFLCPEQLLQDQWQLCSGQEHPFLPQEARDSCGTCVPGSKGWSEPTP